MTTPAEPSFGNEDTDCIAVGGVRRPAFRDTPWRLIDVAIALAPLLVVRIVHGVSDPVWFSDTPRWMFIAVGLAVFGWILAYPLWIARRVGTPLQLPGLRAWMIEGALAVPILLAIWVGATILDWVWTVIVGQPPITGNVVEQLGRSRDTILIAFVVLAAVTIGPLAEEVLFRGMVYNSLRQRLPWIVAALIQALLFGFAHTFGITHAVQATFMGFALSVVYEWRKTLLTPILIHGLQNLAAVAVVLWAMSQAIHAPMLGVHATPHDGGCVVTQVVPGSAAEEAGLRVDDVITAVDGATVEDIRGIATVVSSKQVGESVRIDFVRDGEPRTTEAILKARGQ